MFRGGQAFGRDHPEAPGGRKASAVQGVLFFFQGEDGIRVKLVTGVQTCALPICALQRIGDLRFPAKVLPEAREGIALMATHEKPPLSDALRHVAQVGTVSPQDDAVISKDRLANAEVRTTCVTTMLRAAPQDNVLPTTAEATVNCRILPDETREQTQARIAQAIGDPAVELKPLDDIGFSKPSPISGPVNDAVHAAARALWGDVP